MLVMFSTRDLSKGLVLRDTPKSISIKNGGFELNFFKNRLCSCLDEDLACFENFLFR